MREWVPLEVCSTLPQSDRLVELDRVSASYLPGVQALEDVTLTIRPGECTLVTGPSGSGKTTLLELLRGLLGRHIPASVSGAVRNRALEDGDSVGLVFQNPDTQLFFQTVEEEIAFGAENLGRPPAWIRREIDGILERLGISHLRRRNPSSLSSGEKQKVALGSVLILRPSLLLLDEPLPLLDRRGRQGLAEVLAALKAEGLTLVIADQNPHGLRSLADRLIVLESGRLRCDLALHGRDPVPLLAGMGLAADGPGEREQPWCPGGGESPPGPVVLMKDLTFRYPGGGGVERISLALEPGEILGIQGANGSGKTTLLRAAAGLLKAQRGECLLFGAAKWRAEGMLGKVALVMQNPERQLFEESARHEVLFTLDRIGRKRARQEKDGGDPHARVAQALGRLRLEHVADRNPLTLSLGEQRRLVCACAMAPGPGLLLLDEPTSGLDWPNRRLLIAWMRELRRTCGTAVMVASHDEDLLETVSDRHLRLRDGRIVDGGDRQENPTSCG
ncbi:MAG: ABC transporter ATP-binding protein [bacterium]